MTVAIVVPTYNERENLPLLVGKIREVLESHSLDGYIIIVDDSSPDGTGRVAEALRVQDRRIQVIHRPCRQGVATAYVAGFRRALALGAEYVFQMDADLSHDPRYIPAFLGKIAVHDLVLGTRYAHGGGAEDWSRWRWLISKGGNIYTRTILGLPFSDLTGGYKCYRRRVLERLDWESITAWGFAFQIETTYRVWKMGFQIGEVPIVFCERLSGRSKMSGRIFLEAMVVVWRLRFADLPRSPQDERSRSLPSAGNHEECIQCRL